MYPFDTTPFGPRPASEASYDSQRGMNPHFPRKLQFGGKLVTRPIVLVTCNRRSATLALWSRPTGQDSGGLEFASRPSLVFSTGGV
jgi:hypothetical protein